MRYFQRKMTGLFAALAFTMVYALLRQFPFGLDAAICASFTVLVLGTVVRRRGLGIFSGDKAKPLAEILLVHAVSLAALVIIVRMGIYMRPFLPGWLSTPVGADNQGRVGPTGFQILQSAALFLLGFVEVRVLTAKKPAEDGEAKVSDSLWSKPDMESERMSGLRLR
jgi:hypothetical protein